MQTTTLKAPFGWVGGKSALAKDIIALIPEHKTYVEVFGGGLSVFYAKEKSKFEVINDINSELINLHRIIRNRPQSLSIFLNKLLISRELFYDIKYKKLRPTNEIEQAAFYLFLLTQSFGSKGDNFAMSVKAKRQPKDIYKSYQKWSNRLKGVTIENKSFQELIKLYDKDDSFFYLDPPYVKTEKYYKNTLGFGVAEHEELANILSNIKGKFLLSYNDCSFIRELYKDFKIIQTKQIQYRLGKNIHKQHKTVKEILILNY